MPGNGLGDTEQYLATTSLTFQIIEAWAGRRLLLHAAGLATEDGRVLGLVCASGGGKSTAARTLGQHDFGYVTDETLVVDADALVTAYPKPLAFVSGPGKVQRSPDELGLRPCPEPLTLSRLVVLDRQDEPHSPTLTRLPLLDGLLALLPQTSALTQLDTPLRRLAETVAACGGVHRLTYTDIGETRRLLTDLLDASPAGQTFTALSRPATLGVAAGSHYLTRPWQDALQVEDEGLLLVEGTAMRLAGIGLTLWRAVADGVPDSVLSDHVQQVHGPHPDADHMVRQALAQLAEAGALVRVEPQT